MKRILDYIRLRSKGLSIRKAWQVSSVHGFSVLDFVIVLAWLVFMVVTFIQFDLALTEEHYTDMQASMWTAKVRADTYEKIIIGCLNDGDISINKVNHECVIRPYKGV